MSSHAIYSPSGAHRWMRCPASHALELLEPRSSSSYADEGTAAHSLASITLENPKMNAQDFVDMGGSCPVTNIAYHSDMAHHVQTYVDSVREYAKGHLLLIEQKVDFSNYLKFPNSFGTSDAVILTSDGTEIQAHDLKFGMGVAVYADNNEQLMLYALGCLNLLEMVENISTVETIRLVIHQPRQGRISEWTCELNALLEFAMRAAIAVKATQEPNPEFVPGEKQCEFCKVKSKCPALHSYVMTIVGDTFEDLDKVKLLTKEQKLHIYHNFDMIHDFMKAIRGDIEGDILAGVSYPGLKLVEGRMGSRQWGNEDEVEKLMKSMRLKDAEMYDKRLVSAPQAEKKFKKDHPTKWKRLQQHIVQKQGQPSVVPESDKRPALIVTPPGDDFEDMTGEDLV